MSKLGKLLAYLSREGVEQVILRADEKVTAVTSNGVRPITAKPLTLKEIEGVVAGTELASLLNDVNDGALRETSFELEDRFFSVKAYLEQQHLTVLFARRNLAALNNGDRASAREAPPPLPRDMEEATPKGKPGPPPIVPSKGQPEPPPQGKTGTAPPSLSKKPPQRPLPNGTSTSDNGPIAADAPPRTPPHPPEGARGPDKASLGAIDSLLANARQITASDVHISSGCAVQIRRFGVLRPSGDSMPHEKVQKMMMALLDQPHRIELETRGYTDLVCELPKSGRFRVNVVRQRRGLKGCFRLIPNGPSSLSKLGLPKALSKIVMHHQGLVVVSGPSGSGKTTTMGALLDLFNQDRPIHIITVEDPIEIIYPAKRAVISQRQVGLHTKTFQSALKAALREDPDVIAIGELRDQETVEMALSAAETGHLVISTMSTRSGALTIDRLIDMFPQEVQTQVRNTLSVTLKMVISQRLVATQDGKHQYPAIELITGSIPLCALIRDNKLYQLPSLLQQGRAYGMIRMEESLSTLVKRGFVSLDEARAHADDPKSVVGEPEADAEAKKRA